MVSNLTILYLQYFIELSQFTDGREALSSEVWRFVVDVFILSLEMLVLHCRYKYKIQTIQNVLFRKSYI